MSPIVHTLWSVFSIAESFAENDADTFPDGWTDRWESNGSTWKVITDASSSGGMSLQNDTTFSARRFLSWDEAGTHTDVEVLSLLSASATSVTESNQNRLIVRGAGGAGNETGVFLGLTVTGVKLETYRNGVNAQIGPAAEFSWSGGDRIMFRLRVIADSVKAKVWIPSTPDNPTADEPASWAYDVTQTNVPAGGYVGVGAFNGGDITRKWEWFSVAFDGETAQIPS